MPVQHLVRQHLVRPHLVIALLFVVGCGSAVATHRFDMGRPFDIHEISPAEVRDTLTWLDDFYASPEGLQRPSGLVRDGRVDTDAIATWLFEVYMLRRAERRPPEQSRDIVAYLIRQTPEWIEKHPGASPPPK